MREARLLGALVALLVVGQVRAEWKSPLSPRDSLKHLRVAPGLKVELVAHEPLVVDPVAIRFDEKGVMWVVEMRDYPHGPKPGGKPASRIRRLEDRDGDGFFESASTFADELLFVTGLQPWRDGVIVTLAGRVVFMRDTNGDGRADEKTLWYRGFAEENSQLRANHPRFALDNRIYIANGLRGGIVTDPRKKAAKKLSISGMDFRFNPLTFAYEAASGVGQFGLTFDDYGNRFVCSNRNPLKHIVLENDQIRKNAKVPISAVAHDVAVPGEASRIFPISRAWTTSTLHAGQFTAACGVLIFRGTALGSDFRGNGFTCDPTGNLVHREVLRPLGATFQSRAARKGVEFLASPDEWFRPVNLTLGPDGALYVVDMYRGVIEHPRWMPAELKERPDVRNGDTRGRIYRIVASDWKRPRSDLKPSSAKQLLAWVESANAWKRETAARLVFERQDEALAGPLSRLAVDAKLPVSRIQALWILQGLGQVRPVLASALKDRHPRVREQAVTISEGFLEDVKVRQAIVELAGDEDARVRFRVALCLAGLREEWRRSLNVSELLATIVVRGDAGDEWVQRAVLLAAGDQSARVAVQAMKLVGRQKAAPMAAITGQLTALAGRLSPPEDVSDLLRRILSLTDENRAEQLQAVRGLITGLSRRRLTLRSLNANDESLQRSMVAFWQRTREMAANKASADRLQAIELLAYDATAVETLTKIALHDAEQDPRVRAISSLSRLSATDVWPVLLQRFAAESPATRRAILDALLANSARTKKLLDAIEKKQVRVSEIDRIRANRLTNHSNPDLKGRARKLFADAVPGDRKKVLADYQRVLKIKANANRGRLVFQKNCATCHRIGKVGVDVAPDIADSRTRTPAQLLTDIIQPNRAIDSNYVSYSVRTDDGKIITGILSAETSSSITIRQPENKTRTLLRTEIEQLRSNGISLMPEGLEKNINHQQMADLISFIKNWRYLDGRTPLGPSKSP